LPLSFVDTIPILEVIELFGVLWVILVLGFLVIPWASLFRILMS